METLLFYTHVLMITTLVSFSDQTNPNLMNHHSGFRQLSHQKTINDCFLKFSADTVDRINHLKADLQNGRYAAVVLHVEIYMNDSDSVNATSDIIWTMTNKEGMFVSTVNSSVAMTAYSKTLVKLEQIQGNMTCIDVSYDNDYIPIDFIGAFLNFLRGSNEGLPDVDLRTCNETSNCTKTCGRAVDEPFLVNITYFWVVVILLYCPNLVYVFYDALHIKEDSMTHYRKKDCPYGGKRFLLNLSYYLVCLCPIFRKHLKTRPVIRTIVILWIVSIIVQCVNIWLQLSDLSSKLPYKEIDDWIYASTSQLVRYNIYGAIVVGGMVITLLLLHVIPTGIFKRLLEDPGIFIFSSAGDYRTFFVKKTKLKTFLKHVDRRELTDGQTLIAMHAERFILLFNPRFWLLVVKESFSGLVSVKAHVCLKLMILIPGFIFCVGFLTVNVVLNLLWGLYPLLGLFFSCLSLVNSWLELFRVCFIALYFAFFVLIICGNNLVFVFNLMIYTALYTIPCSSFDDLSKYFMIFPILLYVFFYWTKFTGGYRKMLENIFKLESETESNKDSEEESSRHGHRGLTSSSEMFPKPVVTKKVSIEEFDFVCCECSPVRKKILNLLIKTIVTGIFILLTLTVLFLRRKMDSFSKVAQTVAFVVIILLPRLIEKFWSSDETAKDQDLEEKISAAVRRWKYEQRAREKDGYVIDLDGVNCSWWNSCCNISNMEDSEGSIQTGGQEYELKEGSLSMLSASATEEEQGV